MSSESVPDYQIINAMKIYGGSFVQALAEAAARADDANLERIKTAFPELWQKYTEMGQKRLEEERAQ